MGKTVFQLSPDGGTTKYDLRDSNIAPIELDSAHASRPYAVNEEFVLDADGNLYTATSPISQGSAIVVYPTSGYNCKPSDSVTRQIIAVKDGLGTASTKNAISVVTDSSDLVESGAVKDIVGWGNKNKLPFPYKDTTRTVSGITFTVIDQSVSVSGLLNGVAPEFNVTEKIADDRYAGLILSCGVENTSNVFMRIRIGKHSTGAFIRELKGDNLTIPTLGDDEDYFIAIRVEQATQISPAVVFYPMISKDGGAYEPYHASVEETLRDAEVIEGKNLLLNETQSTGIFTVNTDKSISVNGSLSGWTSIIINANIADVLKPNTEYVLSGCFAGGSISTYSISILDLTNNQVKYRDTGNGVTFNTADLDLTHILRVRFTSDGTVTFSNKIIYPMLRLASETDPTYEPYYVPLKDVVPTKADNSVIGTVENGPTASQDYAVGQHFIRDGAFCTCIQPIAQGGTFTLNTNYTAGDVASELNAIDITEQCLFSEDCTFISGWTHIYKVGKIVWGSLRFTTPATVTADKAILTLPNSCKSPLTVFIGIANKAWTGETKAMLQINANTPNVIRLTSTTWEASAEVVANIMFKIE